MLLLEEAASIRIKQIVISSRHKTRKEHQGAFPKGAFGAKLNRVRNIILRQSNLEDHNLHFQKCQTLKD